MECIAVQPTDALRAVKREHHTRKRGAYILIDKYDKYLIVAQRLHLVASYLNSLATDAASRVSITALHDTVSADATNRVGGYVKHRWRLVFAPLEETGTLFERERARFENTLILGQRECYSLCASGSESAS